MSDDVTDEEVEEKQPEEHPEEQPEEVPEEESEEQSAVAETGDDTEEPQARPRDSRRRGPRRVSAGIAHVVATFNNTRVSISDQQGNVLAWSSGGRLGFKGSRKSTGYVAQQVGADAAKRAATFGMRDVEVRLKGPGAGRESAVRGIAAAGMNITILRDVTPIPHNGCRPPKRRRV